MIVSLQLTAQFSEWSDRSSFHTAQLSGVAFSCCCVHIDDGLATGCDTLHDLPIIRIADNSVSLSVWSAKYISQPNTCEN